MSKEKNSMKKPVEYSIEIERACDLGEAVDAGPHCKLPPYYFDRANAMGHIKGRKLLTVSSRDGRDVMSVES